MPLSCEIPVEIWTDKEVNLNHLCTFSCISYVHIEQSHRRKLDLESRSLSLLDMKLMSRVSILVSQELQNP